MFLIVSAHPDDAEFGMGGSLIRFRDEGIVLHQAVLTKGEAGTFGTPQERETEMIAVGKHLGMGISFLGLKDNYVMESTENIRMLALLIRTHKPRVIFAPYHTNRGAHTNGAAHPDHTELGSMIAKAARFAKFKNADLDGEAHAAERIIYWMVPDYVKPSFVIDVSGYEGRMVELWRVHESQMALREGKILESLMESRKRHARAAGVELAEAFITEELVVLGPSAL